MNIQSFDGKNVLIAVSTGVDSMVLLDLVLKMNCKVFVVHINHHLRAQSNIEQKFLEEYCEIKKVDLSVFDFNYTDGNFEASARSFRYKKFKEVYDKNNCDVLLTAHHGDDLVETMMMRLLRGGDINSLGGFKKQGKINNMNVVRPLINFSKQMIVEYAICNEIPFYNDESNLDDSYTRNYIRNNIVNNFSDNYIASFGKISDEFYELSEYINSKVENSITILNDIYIDLELVEKPLLKYAVKKALLLLYVDKINLVNDQHVNNILTLPNKLQLPNNYFVFYRNNRLIFSKCIEEKYNYEYNSNLEFTFLNSFLSFKEKELELRIDESMKLPLRIVNANLNDKIHLKEGSQKLSRVFINAKISQHKRSSWPVLVDDDGVVICVFGLKYSIYCLNTARSSKIMIQYKCIFKGDDYNA